jgi:hypothetical protein
LNRETPALPTRVGHAEWGDNRFRGHSVVRELAGRETIAGLLALAIGGRRVDPVESGLLDDIGVVASVGDPRIWPLKLVRITASYGGCLAAVAAVNVCSEGAMVGQHGVGAAAALLLDLSRRMRAFNVAGASPEILAQDDLALEDECRRLLEKKGRLFGFGVPFRERDERLDMLIDRVAARERGELPYWRLFTRVAETVRRIRLLEPNIGLGAAAVCLDIGFTPGQIGPLVTALCSADFWANAFEGAEQAPPGMQSLPLGSVRYVGPPPISSPRAAYAGKGAKLRRLRDE